MTKVRIGSIAILICALFSAASAITAYADIVEYYWNAANGDWSDGSNWDPAGPPSGNGLAFIDNGGTAVIDADILAGSVQHIHLNDGVLNQSGYDVETRYVPIGANGGVGIFNMSDGVFSASYILVGVLDGTVGTGYINMSGGTMNAQNLLIGYVAGSYGEFNISDGTLNVTNSLTVGYDTSMSDAIANQTGGDIFVGNNLYISYLSLASDGHGIYNMSGGTLTISQNMYVGIPSLFGGYDPTSPYYPECSSDGRLFFTGGYITVDYHMHIHHPDSYINDSAAPGGVGGTLELWGDLHNYSEARNEFDLRHTTVILHGGTGWDGTEWHLNVLDMNSADFGATVAGLDDNFAIGNLVFSGQPGTSQWYRLESDIYCYGLSIEEGALIDLNGYNLYYMPDVCGVYHGVQGSTFQLSGQWFNMNIFFDGELIEITDAPPVPEPGTIVLIGSSLLALAGVVRKRIS